MIADASGRQIIALAQPKDFDRINALVAQFDVTPAVSAPRRLQIIKLDHIRAEASLPNIQNLVNERMSEKPFVDAPKPTLLADSGNNRILVTATESQLREIEKIVQIIDVAPEREAMEMRTLKLTARTASEVIPMVTQLLDQTKDPTMNPQMAPKLIPDATCRQIIALARPKDFDRIQSLVTQFEIGRAHV